MTRPQVVRHRRRLRGRRATLSVPSSTLDGRHPSEAADVVSGVREALEKLAAGGA